MAATKTRLSQFLIGYSTLTSILPVQPRPKFFTRNLSKAQTVSNEEVIRKDWEIVGMDLRCAVSAELPHYVNETILEKTTA